jgi:hypothetical protein
MGLSVIPAGQAQIRCCRCCEAWGNWPRLRAVWGVGLLAANLVANPPAALAKYSAWLTMHLHPDATPPIHGNGCYVRQSNH